MGENGTQGSICAICQHDLLRNNESLVSLSCGHVFHENCISGWCSTKPRPTCPLCRQLLRTSAGETSPYNRIYLNSVDNSKKFKQKPHDNEITPDSVSSALNIFFHELPKLEKSMNFLSQRYTQLVADNLRLRNAYTTLFDRLTGTESFSRVIDFSKKKFFPRAIHALPDRPFASCATEPSHYPGYALAGDSVGILTLIHLPSNRVCGRYSAGDDPVLDVSWTNQTVVSGHASGQILVWEVVDEGSCQTADSPNTLELTLCSSYVCMGAPRPITSVDIIGSGRSGLISIGDWFGGLTLVDLSRLTEGSSEVLWAHSQFHTVPVRSTALLRPEVAWGGGPGTSLVLSGDMKGMISIWDPRQTSASAIFRGHEGAVMSSNWSESVGSNFFATAGSDGGGFVWDMRVVPRGLVELGVDGCYAGFKGNNTLHCVEWRPGSDVCLFGGNNQLISWSPVVESKETHFYDMKDHYSTIMRNRDEIIRGLGFTGPDEFIVFGNGGSYAEFSLTETI